MKKTTLHPVARPFFYWAIKGFIIIQLQLHQHFKKELCHLLRRTVLLLKLGMDRIDKTGGKKVDSMPPICTCGYSIANGRWMMLGKAAYLFVLNAYFIFLSANIVSYAGFRIPAFIPTRKHKVDLKRLCLGNMARFDSHCFRLSYFIGCTD